MSSGKIWDAVWKIKFETKHDAECDEHDLLILNQESQVDSVIKELAIESSEKQLKNTATENLELAAKMYLYLNLCPINLRPWFLFYQELFENNPLDQIILTLNRIIKGQGANGVLKNMAKKLFLRSTAYFSLEYKEIQSMFLRRSKNSSLIYHGADKRYKQEGLLI